MPGSHCRLLLNHSIAAILRVPGSSFAFFANANLSPLLALLHVAMSSQYSCSPGSYFSLRTSQLQQVTVALAFISGEAE